MKTEQEIIDQLLEKFAFLQDKIYVQNTRRIFSKFLVKEEFEQVIRYVHDEMGFFRGHHVVGTDEGADLGFIYIVSNEDEIILSLKEKAPKADPQINSMVDIYPSFLIHERELVDLFGAIVHNMPEGPTYPLPDGWPKGNYPLRKEWNPKYFDQDTMTYNPPQENTGKEDESK